MKKSLPSLLLVLFANSVISGPFGPESNSEWIVACKQYSQARNECAVASDYSKCMNIKLGSIFEIYKSYCSKDGTPEWYLMGRKPPK